MPQRFEYFLDLTAFVPKHLPLAPKYLMKQVSISDTDDLATLMLDAYRGTIDYHGEDIDDAREEVRGYFRGRSGGIDPRDFSRAISNNGRVVSACLSVKSDQQAYPLIAYSMTMAAEKRMGLAQHLLASVLHELKRAGYGGVFAIITEGNIPSERLFRRAGFEVVNN